MLQPRKWINSLFVLALVTSGAWISINYFRANGLNGFSLSRSLLNGETTAAFAEAFNRAVPFRDFAIDLWGTLSYGLFHEGRKGVLIGADGWLFTTEEFQTSVAGALEAERKLHYIAQVQAALRARGSDLMIALLPAKARIYPEYLGHYRLPRALQDQYDQVLERLHQLGIPAPDLRAPLLQAKAAGPVFLKTDTHWTTHGARVVARTLANALKPLGLPATAFAPEELAAVAHHGDLLRYVRVNSLVQASELTPDALHPVEAHPVAGNGDLFDGAAIPVALVGTSYSANPLWSFEASLKLEAGVDVINAAKEGFGPIEPMVDYLRGLASAEAAPQIVVWEIPERYMAKPQEDLRMEIPETALPNQRHEVSLTR